MQPSEWNERLSSGTCTVIGLGISNLPLIDYLLSKGVTVTARDRKSFDALGDTARQLQERGVQLYLGETYLQGIREDVIFRSPGLRPDLPELLQATQRGAILSSEMELFLDLTPATVIGITGSDGKTTTTTLTGLFLERACRERGFGTVFVGGNIGEPLLPRMEKMTGDDFAVVELSSFQLQTVRHSPKRAAITNLTPNHLNWHRDMEEYAMAKTNICMHEQNRLLVTNADNDRTQKIGADFPRRVIWFSSKRDDPSAFPLREGDGAVYCRGDTVYLYENGKAEPMVNRSDILLPGVHNLENYMTAIALTAPDVSKEAISAVARSFGGVAHRLERIRTVGGVTYYNSSIDSSPTRTAAALSALREKPIVICGGYDKNIPFEPLAEALCRRASAVILTGATAGKIHRVLDACPEVQSGALPVWEEPDFTSAVLLAHDRAEPGDTVLLSPACASFDAFPNFEVRGNTFRRIVEGFAEPAGKP